VTKAKDAGPPGSERHLIRDDLDVFEARRAVRRMAQELGFPLQAREELVIVVSELGSNILKYGVRGDITIAIVTDERRGVGIHLVAHDIGPPIENLKMALTDGYSDRGPIDPLDLRKRKGFGGGLGAVVRLTDSFEYQPGTGEKRLCVIRYLRKPKSGGMR
jgi:anti-sigma regulatory factor (Ser/Thr protein kinase)